MCHNSIDTVPEVESSQLLGADQYLAHLSRSAVRGDLWSYII